MTESLQPVVTSLKPVSQVLLPFTDYSRWARKHTRGSATRAPLSPLSKTGLRKTIKPRALEAKMPSMPGANVRLQPMAVCSHGPGLRRRLPSVNISTSPQIKVYKDDRQGKVEKSPAKQQKSRRKSHEPTSIRLLKV